METTQIIRVGIVDDHTLVRNGLRLLLDQHEDISVAGEASDGFSAIDMAAEFQPDIIVMDVMMPGMNGIEATRQILERFPDVKIVALSAFSDKCFITDMFKAGVRGYLLKDCIGSELIGAIRTVAAGDHYLGPQVAGVVIEGCITNKPSANASSPVEQLTIKERHLLQLLAEGHTNKEAARMLHVSSKTVDARRRVIMEKTGLNTLAELTKLAIREGLTSLDY